MNELVNLRQENIKVYDLGGTKRQLVASIGAVHYKDNYADPNEPWKDIDLTWEGSKITKAPYELTLEGNKLTLKDKKSGEISSIELLKIGNTPIPLQAWQKSKGLAKAFDTDLEIVAENSAVKFVRILNSDSAPIDAQFAIKTDKPILVRARDRRGALPVAVTPVEGLVVLDPNLPVVVVESADGVVTEAVTPDRPVEYPVRTDPTWQVGASSDDALRRLVSSYFHLAESCSAGCYEAGVYYQYGAGMRFTNITIPQGTTITQAYLTLRCGYAEAGTGVYTRISAEDVDDAPTFADDAAAFDARWAARTTARVDWDYPDLYVWELNVDYDSVEIKTVIQEIVDRAGWVSGNDIVIFWEDFENRSFQNNNCHRDAYSYDGSTTYAPKLIITWFTTQAVGGGAITPASTLGRNIAKVVGAGAITPSSILSTIMSQAVSVGAGAITPMGTLIVKIMKAVGAGAITPSGTVTAILRGAIRGWWK